MSFTLISLLAIVLLLSNLLFSPAQASPFPRATARSPVLQKKQYVPGVSQPYFPADIASCVACEPQWGSISSCAAAAPVFQSFSSVIFNPAAFVSQIQCACTDTFSSAYPQCVDCFVQTNQCSEYLGVPSEAGASSILDGIRQVCGFGSALLGGVATSQASAGISYTYTGIASQGYPTTTSYGVGGIDLGSAQGASTSAATRGAGASRTGLAMLIAALAMLV